MSQERQGSLEENLEKYAGQTFSNAVQRIMDVYNGRFLKGRDGRTIHVTNHEETLNLIREEYATDTFSKKALTFQAASVFAVGKDFHAALELLTALGNDFEFLNPALDGGRQKRIRIEAAKGLFYISCLLNLEDGITAARNCARQNGYLEELKYDFAAKWAFYFAYPDTGQILKGTKEMLLDHPGNPLLTIATAQQALCNLAGGASKPVVGNKKSTGRNSSCPCGSGKKYKKCCMGKPPTQ